MIIVIEVDQSCYRWITNSYGSSISSFEYHCWNSKTIITESTCPIVLRIFRSLDSFSDIAVILGDLNLIDDSGFDVHDVLMSLLQGEVSLKMSVVVKSISDLFSEALPDESSEDEVLLLQTVTCQNGQMQRTVEDIGGVGSVNNARQVILTDLMFECGLTFTVESRKAERACVNMTSILIC